LPEEFHPIPLEEHMKRTIGIVLAVVGVVGAVLSLAADVLGFGDYPGINWAQWVAAAAGAVVAVLGIWLVFGKFGQK
jgi:uncharacterized membrane protein YeaQ/YmgE (transglycosylase-associated protein family)